MSSYKFEQTDETRVDASGGYYKFECADMARGDVLIRQLYSPKHGMFWLKFGAKEPTRVEELDHATEFHAHGGLFAGLDRMGKTIVCYDSSTRAARYSIDLSAFEFRRRDTFFGSRSTLTLECNGVWYYFDMETGEQIGEYALEQGEIPGTSLYDSFSVIRDAGMFNIVDIRTRAVTLTRRYDWTFYAETRLHKHEDKQYILIYRSDGRIRFVYLKETGDETYTMPWMKFLDNDEANLTIWNIYFTPYAYLIIVSLGKEMFLYDLKLETAVAAMDIATHENTVWYDGKTLVLQVTDSEHPEAMILRTVEVEATEAKVAGKRI